MDSELLLFLGISLALISIGRILKRSRIQQMRDISDEEFLATLDGASHTAQEQILAERRKVGRILGIPPEKLAASHNFRDLSKRFEYLGNFGIAWTDLDDEVRELRRALDIQEDGQILTVGEYVSFVAGARTLLGNLEQDSR